MRRIVITGAGGALGQAVCEAFGAAGAAVAGIHRGGVRLNGAPVSFEPIDLADRDAAGRAFAAAWAALGGVDVLVNVAGGFAFERLEGGPEIWSRMFAANLTTCANMCRAAAPRMSAGGAIINIGATAAEHASAGMGPYAASKAAVARLTEALAAELEGRIRVNAVAPRTLDTPQNRADMPEVDPAAWTAPRAVAEVVLFLASDASRAVNGVVLPATAPTSR